MSLAYVTLILPPTLMRTRKDALSTILDSPLETSQHSWISICAFAIPELHLSLHEDSSSTACSSSRDSNINSSLKSGHLRGDNIKMTVSSIKRFYCIVITLT